ncbi:MAG: hypothetical protein IJX63_01230 [Lachnospiraceae bacterium]|nr:hypothetical protein [Lachnospiraceae bacterium]
MRWKNLAKAVTFCAILLFIINGIYKVLSWKDTAGAYVSSVETLYDLDEDLVDVLFLGSSHCYCTINNSKLWEEQGIASFSLAISGQDIAASYYCMVEALKTQTPEVVCVEVYNAINEGYAVTGNLYRNTLSLKFSPNFYEAVDSMVTNEEEKGAYWLKWPIIHTRYGELQKGDFQTEYPAYIGYSANFETQPMSEIVPYTGDEMLPIPQSSEQWLRKMMALAEEKGIQLCFLIAPCIASEQEQKQFLYIEQLAQEEGITYINTLKFKDELGIDVARDFIDGSHTNHYGAEKVTAWLGSYLKEQYTLQDRRGSAGYELWEQDWAVRQHEVQNRQLQQNGDLKSYLDNISVLSGYVVILASSGEYINEEVDFADNLQGLGIGEAFWENGGIWVFDEGEALYSSLDADALFYTELTNGDLAVSSNGGKKNIIIDKQSYMKVDNAINIVVYDKIAGKVVDAVGFYAPNQYVAIR